MLDGGMALPFHRLNYAPVLKVNAQQKKYRTQYGRRQNSAALQFCVSFPIQTDETKSSHRSKKISGSGIAPKRNKTSSSLLLNHENTVGIIGGVSVLSTLVFLEKLVWWSSRDGGECLPFVVCSDPEITRMIPSCISSHSTGNKNDQISLNSGLIIENMRQRREFLEQSGAHCIVMPCHISHRWYNEISQGCLLPFLHAGECVASDLKEAGLKPLEAGSNVRIGVLATNATLASGFYQDKLQTKGFEVVIPEKATMNHIFLPAIEALSRRDREGARNLLRIAIQVLLVKAANIVILAADEIQGLLPCDDPLLKKCIDPMDALARSTIRWAKRRGKVHKYTPKGSHQEV